jgi:hypothetical protein
VKYINYSNVRQKQLNLFKPNIEIHIHIRDQVLGDFRMPFVLFVIIYIGSKNEATSTFSA